MQSCGSAFRSIDTFDDTFAFSQTNNGESIEYFMEGETQDIDYLDLKLQSVDLTEAIHFDGNRKKK
jgi:hypothetical protein